MPRTVARFGLRFWFAVAAFWFVTTPRLVTRIFYTFYVPHRLQFTRTVVHFAGCVLPDYVRSHRRLRTPLHTTVARSGLRLPGLLPAHGCSPFGFCYTIQLLPVPTVNLSSYAVTCRTFTAARVVVTLRLRCGCGSTRFG